MNAPLSASPPPEDASWSAKGVAGLTVHIPGSVKHNVSSSQSRWRTPEFLVYAVVFVFALPLMVLSVLRLSQSSHPNYALYKHRLAEGWLFGRQVDTSDAQYRGFRSNFPALVVLALVHLGASHINTLLRPKSKSRLSSSFPSIDISFSSVFSVLVIFALHGLSGFKILAILSVNYLIAVFSRGHSIGILLTWAFNIAILFANETYDGYKYGSVHPSLASLDDVQGFYPRWNVTFNITVLRLISFNMDYIWAVRKREPHDAPVVLNDRTRVSSPHPDGVYHFRNYIAYILYPPLYIAGPIMTFNDFMWQVCRPSTIPPSTRLAYGLRFVVSLLTMEFVLHFIYVVAIKDAKAWTGDTPFELAMIGFWNLIVMWLKLLIPWRFFRLWALLDGIDPPENMVRCVANNYSTLGFWRSWHRSYNLWLIRYIYVPLGGSSSSAFLFGILPKLLVFTFVALWHDLSMRLLVWGWLISLFILPELIAGVVLPASKYGDEWWYRHVCAAGGALNVLLMMSANLVGFVLGTEGTAYLWSRIVGTWSGWGFVVLALPCLFVGVQVMFEYREEEKRRGIVRKC